MNRTRSDSYIRLRDSISRLYKNNLSRQDAEEATRNFIGFSRLLLEIKREQSLDSNHEQSNKHS